MRSSVYITEKSSVWIQFLKNKKSFYNKQSKNSSLKIAVSEQVSPLIFLRLELPQVAEKSHGSCGIPTISSEEPEEFVGPIIPGDGSPASSSNIGRGSDAQCAIIPGGIDYTRSVIPSPIGSIEFPEIVQIPEGFIAVIAVSPIEPKIFSRINPGNGIPPRSRNVG